MDLDEAKGVEIHGWYSTPVIYNVQSRVSRESLSSSGAVDAYALMAPFFDNPILKGTIRMMDVLNGCGRQCDTCLAAAAIPSKMFTAESLERLFSEPKFIEMLSPKLRIGSAGDVQDHPEAVKITQMILEKTGDKKIKIVTNYRPNDEEKLLGLVGLALKYPERFHLTISLPLNKTLEVNDRFYEFIKGHKDVFANLFFSSDLMPGEPRNNRKIENISVFDVSKSVGVYKIGRVLATGPNARTDKSNNDLGESATMYSQRGFVKVQLNPDALWLMVYATMKESHTTRLYTPLTNQNVGLFSKLPWHPDFTTPPNWAGGKGERNDTNAFAEIKRDKANGKANKPVDLV